MKYAEYVITGWVLTGATLAGYWAWILRRTMRAEASLAQENEAAAHGTVLAGNDGE